MWAWQFSKAQHLARAHGWTPFVTMQDHYNLLNREEEREMHPYCLDSGVGVIPWSPLARGTLTRPWNSSTARTETDVFGQTLYHQTEASDRKIVDAVAVVADARGIPRARVALAWVAQQDAVTAPIVGATKPNHLDDAAAAVELVLTDDELAQLEQHYAPHAVEGF
jgi:aryl-alcohol dehydrogenase-like predicted oxidoreductase